MEFHFVPSAEVVALYPNHGLESGRPVFVLGRNFRNTSITLTCRFGSFIVSAIHISDEILLCFSPPQPPGAVPVAVSMDGLTWTLQRILFHYRKCVEGSYCRSGDSEEVSLSLSLYSTIDPNL